jgi:hypothetical protein
MLLLAVVALAVSTKVGMPNGALVEQQGFSLSVVTAAMHVGRHAVFGRGRIRDAGFGRRVLLTSRAAVASTRGSGVT